MGLFALQCRPEGCIRERERGARRSTHLARGVGEGPLKNLLQKEKAEAATQLSSVWLLATSWIAQATAASPAFGDKGKRHSVARAPIDRFPAQLGSRRTPWRRPVDRIDTSLGRFGPEPSYSTRPVGRQRRRGGKERASEWAVAMQAGAVSLGGITLQSPSISLCARPQAARSIHQGRVAAVFEAGQPRVGWPPAMDGCWRPPTAPRSRRATSGRLR